ncbi:putative quinol monooxygenase [Labrys portucalensis]|uniref:Quinol monooxygenase n=1 Tax=Labrys neptuniae TaxID=376174 RepID=A0ABV6ZQB6_9HYPH
MVTITAIIRVRKGSEAAMRQALLEVAAHVEAHEPRTVSFFVSQDSSDPALFTTYERFVDRAAMDTHNGSPAVARFFAIANPLLEGKVMLVTADEISAKTCSEANGVNGGPGLL